MRASSPSHLLAALALGLCGAVPAHAVIIDSGDGSGNTSAPADDPGWAQIGLRGTLTGIYLGNGWVLTANHVGEGDIVLEGTTYPAVAGSKIQIDDGAGTFADLAVFQLDSRPNLPVLPISAVTDLVGADVIMIGNGRNRGAATSACSPPGPPIGGYEWGPGHWMRWGTNDVGGYQNVSGTEAFFTEFDQGGTAHEAQAATGDSGGAVFVNNSGVWELAGVMFATGTFGCQPGETALYGNLTYAADLAFYRDQILTVVPEPSTGLLLTLGLAGLAAMQRRVRDGAAWLAGVPEPPRAERLVRQAARRTRNRASWSIAP